VTASALTLWLQAMFVTNTANTTSLAIDYVRSWQDDNIASPVAQVDQTATAPNGQQLLTTPPISPDSPDPAIAGSFFNFNATTSEDTTFNHDVYVHGTLFADKIKANQIEGLEVFTDAISSLQDKLASDKNGVSTALSSNGVPSGVLSLNSANIKLGLNIGDALSVGGDSQFHGNAMFYKLVTFMEKTVFNNDVSFAAHVTTAGSPPEGQLGVAAGIIAGDDPSAHLASVKLAGNDNSGRLTINVGDGSGLGELVSVKFKKAYDSPPQVLITPANESAAQLRYYVTSTPDGFKLIASTPPPVPGTTLQLNYWVVQ
jgi:hypothetical protein